MHKVLLAALITLTAIGLIQFAQASPALPDPAQDPAVTGEQSIVLAGGCFWGVEAVFEHVKGVKNVVSGYAGGNADTATYDAVSNGDTGHAEAVKVTYDPAQISAGQLLKIYFSVAHDPTQLNRQGPDTGTQYRSAIFYNDEAAAKVATAYVKQLDDAKVFGSPIVTEITQLKAFYPAEDYHQDYLKGHLTQPYIVMHDLPKLAHLKAQFPAVYVE